MNNVNRRRSAWVAASRRPPPTGLREAQRTILGDIVQTRSVYPIDSDTPTALCHLLPASELPALCGYPWEGLIEVPNATAFEDVPEDLRCRECLRASAVA
jgi:hypothetical protein